MTVWRWQQCPTPFSPQAQQAQLGPLKASAVPAKAHAPFHVFESSGQSENDNGLIVFFQGTHRPSALGPRYPLLMRTPLTCAAADGQRIFLNSLNARCLIREFGNMGNCPADLIATVVQLEEMSVSEVCVLSLATSCTGSVLTLNICRTLASVTAILTTSPSHASSSWLNWT